MVERFTQTLAITGATGFIGTALVRRLLDRGDVLIRALARTPGNNAFSGSARLQWIQGDLADERAIKELLVPGADLVHLAYPHAWETAQHLAAATNLAQCAAAVGIRRIVHCSTAVVTGHAPARVITEATPPRPSPGYEATKLAIEQTWLEYCRGRVELAVLRPTAVYGPGGTNLLKLARDLTSGSTLVNYLRSSVYGRRRMNLVHVNNVLAALQLLLDTTAPQHGEIYIVSDDDEPGNNFRNIERFLMQAWAITDYPVPPLPVPPAVLSTLLRLMGRSNVPERVYDGSKLRRAGLRKTFDLERGLREFAAWYSSTCREPPR